MKIYIAIPSCRDWKPHFGASLCGLVRKMAQDGVDFDMNAMMGTSVIPKARQIAIDHAVQNGFTHVLFLDDDMAFPPDLFESLSRRNLPIVAANYSNKSPEPKPQTHGTDGMPMVSKGKTGVEEAGWVGFGAVLIELSPIKNIEKPLFEMRWIEERQSFIGEDYYFCGKVRAHGVRVYVDHDASQGMAHVGDKIYGVI